MKILLLSDIHLSERPPSSCTDTYCDDLFSLLEQAREVGSRHSVRAMVWAGDTFHHKAPNRVSHRLVQRTAAFIATCRYPVFILAGNHDMSNDRHESIYESQPLGMLLRSGAKELKGWGWDDYPSPLPVYGVPWLQGYGNWGAWEGDGPGPVIEHHLSKALADYRELVYEHGMGRELPLVVAHAPLYPPGKELQYEYFPASRWAEAMGAHRGGRHAVFYGHVHEPHGTYDVQPGESRVLFCNNGALSRGSLHEYNLTRQVGVTIYDTLAGTFEFVPLDARPASEVFRLVEKERVTDLQGRLDEFLSSVGGASLEVVSVESVIAHIRSLGLSREVTSLASELLEAQRGSC